MTVSLYANGTELGTAVATSPGPSDTGNWPANGTIGNGYPGGSYIWNQTPSGCSSQYEVRTNISLTPLAMSGGIFQHYLRAQSNALSGAGGNTVLVELQNPIVTTTSCTANLAIYEIDSGVVNNLLATAVSCAPNTTMRSVVYGSTVGVLINTQYFSATISAGSGAPGFGASSVPSGNSISQVEIGPLQTATPAQINLTSIATSPFPYEIDVRWQEPTDTTGVGIVNYQVERSNNYANNYSVLGTLSTGANTFVHATVWYDSRRHTAHGEMWALAAAAVLTPVVIRILIHLFRSRPG